MLKTITYISSSKIESHHKLLKLFEKAKAYNIKHNISGILILKKNVFLQILEGHSDIVNAVFNKISNDNRHHQIIKLIDFPITNRLFQDYDTSFSLVISRKEFKKLNNYINWLRQADSSCAKKAINILENLLRD